MMTEREKNFSLFNEQIYGARSNGCRLGDFTVWGPRRGPEGNGKIVFLKTSREREREKERGKRFDLEEQQ
jgi:hypothetical protein